MESASARRPPALAIEIAVLAAVTVFAAKFSLVHQTANQIHPPAALEKLCDFSGETPYQNRVLVPTFVRGLEASGIAAKLGLDAMACARWIEFGCVIGLYYALRALLARFLPSRQRATFWAFAGLGLLPILYVLPRSWPYWYPWDVPAVLFTTLGLLWIREERWSAYYWMFPFATLNRETTSLLVLAFAFTQFGKLKWSSYAQHLVVQVAIWACIKRLLWFTFLHNPGIGEYYAKALEDNWAGLHEPTMWETLAWAIAFLLLPLAILAPRAREPFVRRAALLVPLFFAVSFVLAQFDELRIYGELIPFVVLGVACGAEAWRTKLAIAPSTP